MADENRIAVIGLGNMGLGLAGRLLDSGFALNVHNRTVSKAAPVVAAGATLAATPEDAVRDITTVLLSLADEPAVDEVLFGRLAGVLAPGTTVIDVSTVSPGYAQDAARRLAEIGVRRLEATLIGNPQQARAGELRVFTAGEQPFPEQAQAVLDALGSGALHIGPAGSAAALKLVFNLVLGAQVAGLAEAVAYGISAGLDRDMLLAAVSESGFSSMVMRFRAQLMRSHRYQPAFFRAQLMEKDLRIALRDVPGSEKDLPVLSQTHRSFADVVDAGAGDADASVLLEHVIARQSGLPR